MNDLKMPDTGGKKSRKKLWIGIGIAAAVLLIIYIGLSIFFRTHFYFGSMLNGENVTGKTVEEVEKQLSKDIAKYELKLKEKRGDTTETISADQIDLKFVSDGKVQKLKDEQNPFAWPIAVFNPATYDMSATVEYDEAKLKEVFGGLECFRKENMKKPKDAYPEYKNGKFEIVEEDYGNYVIKDQLYELVQKSVKEGDKKIDLEKEKCYQDPKYKKDSKEIVNAAKVMNDYIGVTVTYEFGADKENVDKELIHTWLSMNDKHEVVFSEEKVREYIDQIAREYNTFGRRRPFKTSTGHNITVVGGDYGWLMNREEEVKDLIKVIKEGKDVTREPVYRQTANQHGDDDIGDTYVEVNLSKQHMWFYFKGKLVTQADFVSGNPNRGNGTPAGTYSITYKERDATLNGENYSTPVKYWMPFNGNIGLHDADWRNKFGGEIYKSNGSHGCVNLPPSVAQTLYGYIEKGMPVVCYNE